MAEETATPLNQVAPKPILRKPGEAPVAPTLKLKPVTRPEETPEPPPARETLTGSEGGAIDRLKGLTQRLKAATQEIPAQAILHQTGIIASQAAASESQAQAAKSKTMRISLSEALGAAPTKEEASPSPMKTIRIKRPVDLPRPVEAQVVGTAPAPAAAPAAPAPAAAAPSPTMTQKRTLRIARPANLKTGSHLKLARPGATATQSAPKPAVAPSTEAAPEVADIPEMPVATAPAAPAAQSEDAPTFVTILSLIVQIAACVIMGFVGWTLYQTYSLTAF